MATSAGVQGLARADTSRWRDQQACVKGGHRLTHLQEKHECGTEALTVVITSHVPTVCCARHQAM